MKLIVYVLHLILSFHKKNYKCTEKNSSSLLLRNWDDVFFVLTLEHEWWLPNENSILFVQQES
jgi:hypothetical protein